MVRSILLRVVILAGPIAVFCVLAALPFHYVSWLGGGFIGIVCAMAIPGIICIAMLDLSRRQRWIIAVGYLALYAPVCLLPGFLAACTLLPCAL